MTDAPDQHPPIVGTWTLVAGIGALIGLVVMVLGGVERVRMGRAPSAFRSVWLIEFNWVVFSALLAILLIAIGFGVVQVRRAIAAARAAARQGEVR